MMIRSRNIIATPPGATIKEQLVDRGMSQKEFAARMNMSEKHISNLINGDVQLTKDVAIRLEMVLGVPAHFWNNLESIYREKIAQAEEENKMDADIELSRRIPYSEMVKHTWILPASTQEEKVINLRKFFEVASLELLSINNLMPSIACRRLNITEKSDMALLVWAQKAKIEARSIKTASINVERLMTIVPQIRELTTYKPEIFCSVLEKQLNSCGIAIVYLPNIGGSFLHGATFYDKNKIVIGMTIRGKDADRFWFSLLHEIAHIVFGHINNQNGTTEEEELVADNFAKDALITPAAYSSFVRKHIFTKQSIIGFAKSERIDPGIVVGRLQKEGYINYSWCNDLKTRYVLSDS